MPKGVPWTAEMKAARRVLLAKQRDERVARLEAQLAAEEAREAADPEVFQEDNGVFLPDGRSAEAASLTSAEMFIARMHARGGVSTKDELENEDGILEDGAGSRVEHSTAGLVVMFKHETWGWRRLLVSRNGLDDLVRAGLRDRCGSCGSNRCPGTPNGCPKGKMRMYRDCPVNGCNDGRGKRFYDMDDTTEKVTKSRDAFAIQDDTYAKSTPESRTKAMLDAHIRAWHEQEAIARGLMNITTQVAVL